MLNNFAQKTVTDICNRTKNAIDFSSLRFKLIQLYLQQITNITDFFNSKHLIRNHEICDHFRRDGNMRSVASSSAHVQQSSTIDLALRSSSNKPSANLACVPRHPPKLAPVASKIFFCNDNLSQMFESSSLSQVAVSPSFIIEIKKKRDQADRSADCRRS